ncbi:MAG: response regulator transcription factor [Chitinophagaceae bacterium]|nr:response regulator transcription factor [Chitinophagaceae bacterium]
MVKLVIVDDHRLVREAWKLLLSRDKRLSVIAVCESGAEAVSAARDLQPDIMLMDITMEPMNGVDATRAIREFNSTIKIIGVSVHSDLAHVNAIMNAGANGYVTKNSSGDEMIGAIIQVMDGKRYICKEIHGFD